MAQRWWRTGVAEIGLAMSSRRFAHAAAQFVPELRAADLEPAFTGVRAQAVGRDGSLLDDFVFSRMRHALHVRNAPSPAATSAFAIARVVADDVQDARA
jgi:2-hydroxyglutarate dehydrogenase